jgi:aminoglycoside phosphotransferase (APT) family kinase protein
LAEHPFVIDPPGDAAVALAAAQAAALHWSLPPPELMKSGMNALFATGDAVVLRVGRPTADPASAIWLAELMTGKGIRVPKYVRPSPFVHGDLTVYAIERQHPHGPIDWREVGRAVARLHTIDPGDVAGRYPTPWCSSFPWWQFDQLMDDVGPLLDPAARVGVERALERCAQWRDRVERVVLCHGDVHPGNVLQTADGPMLIDWDLLCTGPAAWDHAPLMTWTERWGGEPALYESFADGYGTSMRGDAVAEALAELRLVAASLMRVRAGRTNPAAAVEAERRLRWWRGDPDAPVWNAM